MFATTVVNKISNSELLFKSRPISNQLPVNDAVTNLSTTSISTSNLSITATGFRQRNPGTGSTQNPNSQNYLSFLVTPEDATTNNSESNPSQTTLTNNILPAMVTKNESLAAIFSFKLEETINPPLFSRAVLEEKLKLILDSGSAGSIITRQLIDQLGH
ncbi:hypothetical protein G9A89_005429 [Geosiphon pyriformis]|nr:hypothetical protein G9A89_005429 [Geosiphon pyriformis]